MESRPCARGGRIWAAKCDVADDMPRSRVLQRVAAELGPVDILVNNAGIARDAHVMLLDSARWDDVLEVNLDVRRITASAPWCAACCCAGGDASSTCRRRARGCRWPGRRLRGVEGRPRRVHTRAVAGSGGERRAGQRGVARADRNRHAAGDAAGGAGLASARRWRSVAPARPREVAVGRGVSRLGSGELHPGQVIASGRRPAVNCGIHMTETPDTSES